MSFVALHQRWVHPLCKRWARFVDYSLTRKVKDGRFVAPRWGQHAFKAFLVGGGVGLGMLLGMPAFYGAQLAFLLILGVHIEYVATYRYPPDPLDWLHEMGCACCGVACWLPWFLVPGVVLYAAFYPYATP